MVLSDAQEAIRFVEYRTLGVEGSGSRNNAVYSSGSVFRQARYLADFVRFHGTAVVVWFDEALSIPLVPTAVTV
jgi:hypothetical protein